MTRPRIVSWFSCGNASAVATKLALTRYGATCEIAVARCVVPEEHDDNDRFAADCAAWFGQPVIELRSEDYASCEDVWTQRRYMAGLAGAACTAEMKRAVRHAFERTWCPDQQVFGFTVEEMDRATRFHAENPEVRVLTPLIDAGLTKADCHAMIERAGIFQPMMYSLGFRNNNCIGCVKAQSPAYWNRVRTFFPDVFERRARLSREIGCKLVKLTTGTRERLFLDELPAEINTRDPELDIECSPLCATAEGAIG